MPRPRKLPRPPLAELGTAPDAEIAARYGVHPQSVYEARKAAGIPAYRRPVEGAPVRYFRASDAEYAPVVAYAEAHGCSESEAIRALIAR